MWTFIVADMAAFALFFLLFSIGRWQQPALYARSQHLLDPELGLANTLILLTSSLFMALAVRAARQGRSARVTVNLVLAIAIGLGFAVIKAIEYGAKLRAGITLTTNEFFTYYFAFTGIHFLHFAIGIVVLLVCLAKAAGGAIDAGFVRWIEASGCYWHMVDLLWIMLFAMIYLVHPA